MKKQKIPKEVLITALIVLGVVQCVAFYFGIDGMFRAMFAALIAGIAGLAIKSPFEVK